MGDSWGRAAGYEIKIKKEKKKKKYTIIILG